MAFRIGVDGGGTKTECVLVDAGGVVLARHTAPGCSPSHAGPEKARAILGEALRDLLSQGPRGPVEQTLLCMAGNPAFWRETASSLQGFGRVETAADHLPVLELATGGGPGLVLHAGTGSFVAARGPDGKVHYAGGLGWRFGDPASGYELGRRGAARALLELQGWAKRTALAEALAAHTGVPDYTTNSRILNTHAEANSKIASFAPRLVELAESGCEPARQVLLDSIGGLAAIADSVLARVFSKGSPPLPCGVSGILLTRPAVFALVAEEAAARAWPVILEPVIEPPIEGVLRLLLKPPGSPL